MTYLESFQPLVESIASRYGARHRVHGAEGADFAQELYIWLWENQGRVLEWAEEYESKHFDRHIAKVLENECKDYARDIKAQALGHQRNDEWFYSRGELKALLPAVFDPEAWTNPPQSDGRSPSRPAEGNNWATTLADISRAFDQLNVADQVLLRSFHEDDRSNKELAEAHGVTEQTMSYRHDRAVKRLLDLLGGEIPRPARAGSSTDPWRGRHAVTNASARAYQDNLYEEA